MTGYTGSHTAQSFLATLGLSRAPHATLVQYVKENPEKVAFEVALTGSGFGNIVRGGRMTYSGIRAVQATSFMRPGLSRAYATYRGASKISKGSRISRRGKLMVSAGGIEMVLDPDIPFVPYI